MLLLLTDRFQVFRPQNPTQAIVHRQDCGPGFCGAVCLPEKMFAPIKYIDERRTPTAVNGRYDLPAGALGYAQYYATPVMECRELEVFLLQ